MTPLRPHQHAAGMKSYEKLLVYRPENQIGSRHKQTVLGTYPKPPPAWSSQPDFQYVGGVDLFSREGAEPSDRKEGGKAGKEEVRPKAKAGIQQ